MRLSPRWGYLLVMLAASLWALNGNVVKPLFRSGTPPLVAAQLRMLFTCVLAGLLILAVRPAWLKLDRRAIPGFAFFGVGGLASVQLTYFEAIALLPIGVAVLLQYLAPVILVVVERLTGKREFDVRVLIALACSLSGCFLAVGAYRADLLRLNLVGTLVALLSAVCFAVYTTQAARLVSRHPVATVLFYGFGFGSLFWLAYDAVLRPELGLNARVVSLMLAVALLGTLIPFGMLIAALRVLLPSRAAIVSTLEPVLAGGIAFLWFNETLEPLQLVGGALVLAAIILAQLESSPAVVPVGRRPLDAIPPR
jgi:drug/metabolite transporter (DMT)-like permease